MTTSPGCIAAVRSLTAKMTDRAPGHFGGRCRFIDEDKPMRLITHARLPM